MQQKWKREKKWQTNWIALMPRYKKDLSNTQILGQKDPKKKKKDQNWASPAYAKIRTQEPKIKISNSLCSC